MVHPYIKAVVTPLKNFYSRMSDARHALLGKRAKLIDLYSDQAPHPQNALDLFSNEWVSKLPAPYEHLRAGNAGLFSDPRLEWVINEAGSIKGKTVLELGPLEGAHAYMLQQKGASVVSIEANPRAYLKCLIIKEILDLHRVQFHYGDFTKYLTETERLYDFCVACGVLYHMRNPVELIAQVAKSASQVFIWTHYYDQAICHKHPKLQFQFRKHSAVGHEGFKHTLFRHDYGIQGKKFFGGPESFSNWLTREDILNACKHFGFKNIKISREHDTPHHVHGPAFAFLASK